MDQLRLWIGEDRGEILAATVAQCLETRQATDRRIDPDIEELAGMAGDLKPKIRGIARDIPRNEAALEPLLELVRDAGLQIDDAMPLAQELCKGQNVKKGDGRKAGSPGWHPGPRDLYSPPFPNGVDPEDMIKVRSHDFH